MQYVQDYDFKNKQALIRADLNVTLDDHLQVVDDFKIQSTISTIQKVLSDGGSAVLMSHLGRPKQGYEEKYSLKHLIGRLSQILAIQVDFVPQCVGPETQAKCKQLQPGQLLLLENVRFPSRRNSRRSCLCPSTRFFR